MKISKRKFTKIYDQYIDKMYRFVFLKVGSQEIAEDLTAQVFVKGWKKFKSGLDVDNPTAYLYQIARREVAGYYRKNKKWKIVSAESVQIIDPAVSPEEEQSNQADFRVVQASLGQLKESYQNVLVWRHIDQLSIKEIAKILDKKPGAVRVMLHRALQELRKKVN